MPPIRKGDGTSLVPKGFAEVRKGDGTVLWQADTAPAHVVHQYDFIDNFSEGDSTVPDSAGSADMSITGSPTNASIGGETGAKGDGTDDHGSADGPMSVGELESWGIAFTFNSPGMGDNEFYFGFKDGDQAFQIYSTDFNASLGEVTAYIRDQNKNALQWHTYDTYDDNDDHAVVVNKLGDSGSDTEIYVDDMDSSTSTSEIDQGFDHNDFQESTSHGLGFWARNNSGSYEGYAEITYGVIEFWDSPLDQSDRDDFVSRRPEA